MLERLKQAGFKLGVVTNAGNLDAEPWPHSSLARFVDVFIASHEVGLLKPDQRNYDLACRQLGARPSETAYAGDGGSDELAGAAPGWVERLLVQLVPGSLARGDAAERIPRRRFAAPPAVPNGLPSRVSRGH